MAREITLSGDVGFEFVADAVSVKLLWGGQTFATMPWQPPPDPPDPGFPDKEAY